MWFPKRRATALVVGFPAGLGVLPQLVCGRGPSPHPADGPDEGCILFKGLCDDKTGAPAFDQTLSRVTTSTDSVNDTLSKKAQAHLQEMEARGAQFFCLSTSVAGEHFLALDPGPVDTSKVVNTQLPRSVEDLKSSWFASSFQYGNAETAARTWQGKTWGDPTMTGFRVNTAGTAFANDGGGYYGNGYGGPPPDCYGEEEEEITCMSSAHNLRQAAQNRGSKCYSTPIRNTTAVNSACHDILAAPTGYIVRNRNAWALGTMHRPAVVDPSRIDPKIAHGTNKYFYLFTVAGFRCDAMNTAAHYLELLGRFGRAFQGMIDIWKLKAACDGRCEIMTGAISAWYSYSAPTSVSLLVQLRAWASLKVDGIVGCKGNQAVLKFGSMSVTDNGVVCCPQPMSGGACHQSFALPTGWESKLTEGSDQDFANWLVSVYPGCSSTFSIDNARCVPHDYTNYVPVQQSNDSVRLSILF